MFNTLLTYPLAGEIQLADIDKKILHQLSQGRLVSGEEIGKQIGTSRAYVWKRIAALKEQGLEVISVHGEGYRLPEGGEVLDKAQLNSELNNKQIPLRICWSLPSTNLAAMALAEQFPGQEFVLLSESQSEGRGRRGKSWQSPFGPNLYLSYKVPFNRGAKSLQGLSLVVGVAIVQALNELSDNCPLALKWPNDVMLEDRKLSGILIEMSGDINGDCDAIIGVGINASYLGGEGEQGVASIHEAIPTHINRNTWTARIINAIQAAIIAFKQQGLQPFLEEWQRFDYLYGQRVKVLLGSHVVEGTAMGANPAGALLVDVGDEVQSFYAGEVSVRKQ